MVKLNQEQLILKDKINDFIKGDKNVFLVNGPGGTGKTLTICNTINPHKVDVIFLGATNKVTGLIRNNLKDNGYYNTPVKTIDSFFGFKMKKDHNNETITSYKIPETIPSVVIIDECSMINNRLTDLISKIKNKTKIILIGDKMQLPPVSTTKEIEGVYENGFKISKVFSLVEDSFELTIQMRQKEGSDLFNLISGFRQHMDKKMNPITIAEKKNNGKDILYLDINSHELKTILQNESNIAICYKNLTVLKYNWLTGSVKTNNKKYKVNSLNVGDRVYFDSFYKNNDVSAYTSEFGVIKTISDFVGTFKHEDIICDYDCHQVVITKEEDGLDYVIYVSKGYKTTMSSIYNKVSYRRKKITSNKEKAELNTAYSNFQLGLAKLKKPFAISCHKAQGSTYENIIVPVYDFSNKSHTDVNQLFYVAISRASKRIIFVNQPLQFNDSKNRLNFTEFERNSIASHYDYKCQHCFSEFNDIREIDIDHEIPLNNAFGTNKIENLKPLCKSCHKLKTINEQSIQHKNLCI